MQNKQKHTLIITIILVLTFSLLILLIRTRANQDGITISPKVHFGLPPYATYINFSTQQTLTNLTLNNASWFWYFEEYGFQIQNANATITNFFIDNQLTLNVYAPTGNTSTTKIYCADKGEPISVKGATSWNYDSGTKILTANISHSSWGQLEIEWTSSAMAAILLLRNNYYLVLGLLALVPIIAGASLIIGVVKGGTIDGKEIYTLLSLIVTIAVIYIVIITMMNALVGT